jgi:hypothetical protein
MNEFLEETKNFDLKNSLNELIEKINQNNQN